MALAIDRYPLGPFQANCYVVRSDRGATEAAVIDPGAQAAELRLELARLGTSCAGILVTHTDVD
ncbi:MAG TPA: MBL fold metallo-hydrolase, partial [Gaiellaceae bacterium]